MAAAAITKQYYINLKIDFKRGREEISVAKTELERLHSYISNAESGQTDWAKKRIDAITEMLLMPSGEKLTQEIQKKLKEAAKDEGEEG